MTRDSTSPEIVIHAGMEKAGSKAIQLWLRGQQDVMARHGFTLAVARPDNGTQLVRVAPHTSGPGSSGPVVALLRDPDVKRQAAKRLADELHRLAEEHGRIVISGEQLGRFFSAPDLAVLTPLNELARDCEVRVAYYVRPQHTALEAGWRQWGFRSGLPPSRYVVSRAGQLRYHHTLEGVTADTPEIDFRMRPFRRDLLSGGDVVKDFAEHILGIDPSEVRGETASNVGVPLVVVNLLATAPEGLLWDSVHDNRRLRRLKEVLADEEDEGGRRLREALSARGREDEKTARGRRLLQRWAHRRFYEENEALLQSTRWDAADWLPDAEGDSADLADLDKLWSPSASPAELALLHLLLERAVRQPPRADTQRASGIPRRVRGARRAARLLLRRA